MSEYTVERMETIGTHKQTFINTWPGGYADTWGADDEEERVAACIAPFHNPAHVAVEIGCGRGAWVRKSLIPNFKHVIALDVIPKPPTFPDGATFIELPDRDYTGAGITDCIDFVWSFGCFCHLPGHAIRAYLKSIHRMLRPDGNAVVMFGNWPRKGEPVQGEETADIRQHGNGAIWFYCDLDLALKWSREAGLNATDVMPEYHHTMLHLRKS